MFLPVASYGVLRAGKGLICVCHFCRPVSSGLFLWPSCNLVTVTRFSVTSSNVVIFVNLSLYILFKPCFRDVCNVFVVDVAPPPPPPTPPHPLLCNGDWCALNNNSTTLLLCAIVSFYYCEIASAPLCVRITLIYLSIMLYCDYSDAERYNALKR